MRNRAAPPPPILRLRLLLLTATACCALLLAAVAAAADQQQLNDDVLGLIVFKSSVEDPEGALSKWNEEDDSPCNPTAWPGVWCSPDTGRIESLNLDGVGLSGRLSSRGLDRLSPTLKHLTLARNNLSGPLPPGLAALRGLQTLNLSSNAMSGPLPPELASFTALQVLDLSSNAFSGAIPESVFGGNGSQLCSGLQYLDLSNNALEGPIQSGLAQCGALARINLSANRLSGDPDFKNVVYHLGALRSLDLSGNGFLTGPVPDGIAALAGLEELQLQGNAFTGPLPSDIGLCRNLSAVDLSSNSFTGELPESLWQLTTLTELNLSRNALSGELQPAMGNLTALRQLDLSENDLSGALPPTLGNLKLLQKLSIASNNLSGEIPPTLAECGELREVLLGGNGGLTGLIPKGLFSLGLERLDLSKNALFGTIPEGSARSYESLQWLDLSDNRLEGNVPVEVGLYVGLRHLNLSWNGLRARVPPELGFLTRLEVLDLRSAELYGSIPGELCDSGGLGELLLDSNSLTGSIPKEIGNCTSLYLLGMSHNKLNGTIPATMSRLKRLKILRLEYNALGGRIPPEMAALDGLLAVNMSHNRLVGRLPTSRIFKSLDQSALQGNLGICSPLVIEPCQMDEVPKPLVLDPNAYNSNDNVFPQQRIPGSDGAEGPGDDDLKSRRRRMLSVSAIVAISGATAIVLAVGVVTLLSASVQRRLRRTMYGVGGAEEGEEDTLAESTRSGSVRSAIAGAVGRVVLLGPRGDLDLGYWSGEQLLRKASEMGRGNSGTVYKVAAGSQTIAVKKLDVPPSGAYTLSHDEFDLEARGLGRARHPNLAPLRGYYWTPNLQLLISDFAPNGSLETRLHDGNVAPLTWVQRFKIALGTAKGLAHLHHSFRPPIVHRAFKPSNVLLDTDLTPMVADFGQAGGLLPSAPSPSPDQMTGGYMAPEVCSRNMVVRIGEKCDVYAYGVMVLELVTGRRAVEEDAGAIGGVVMLVERVRAAVEAGEGARLVDPRMGGKYPEEEAMPVLKLGLVCASRVPSSRPSMAEVVQILHVIKTPVPQRMEAF